MLLLYIQSNLQEIPLISIYKDISLEEEVEVLFLVLYILLLYLWLELPQGLSLYLFTQYLVAKDLLDRYQGLLQYYLGLIQDPVHPLVDKDKDVVILVLLYLLFRYNYRGGVPQATTTPILEYLQYQQGLGGIRHPYSIEEAQEGVLVEELRLFNKEQLQGSIILLVIIGIKDKEGRLSRVSSYQGYIPWTNPSQGLYIVFSLQDLLLLYKGSLYLARQYRGLYKGTLVVASPSYRQQGRWQRWQGQSQVGQ